MNFIFKINACIQVCNTLGHLMSCSRDRVNISSAAHDGSNVHQQNYSVPPHSLLQNGSYAPISQMQQYSQRATSSGQIQQQKPLIQQKQQQQPQKEQKNSKNIFLMQTHPISKSPSNVFKTNKYAVTLPPPEIIDNTTTPPSSSVPQMLQSRPTWPNDNSNLGRQNVPNHSRAHALQNISAYNICKAFLHGKMVDCINAKPYQYTKLGLMLSLDELVENSLITCSVSRCEFILKKYLKIKLYSANVDQIALLKKNVQRRQKRLQHNYNWVMVMLPDIRQVIVQLKNLAEKDGAEEKYQQKGVPAKKIRHY